MVAQKNHYCAICGDKFTSRKEYNHHMANHPPAENPKLPCPTCDLKFGDTLALELHKLQNGHGRGDHVCETCGDAFLTIFLYNEHRAFPSPCSDHRKHKSKPSLMNQDAATMAAPPMTPAPRNAYADDDVLVPVTRGADLEYGRPPTPSDVDGLFCRKCENAYESEHLYNKHSLFCAAKTSTVAHPIVGAVGSNASQVLPPQAPKPVIFACDVRSCRRTFRSKENLEKHKRDTHFDPGQVLVDRITHLSFADALDKQVQKPRHRARRGRDAPAGNQTALPSICSAQSVPFASTNRQQESLQPSTLVSNQPAALVSNQSAATVNQPESLQPHVPMPSQAKSLQPGATMSSQAKPLQPDASMSGQAKPLQPDATMPNQAKSLQPDALMSSQAKPVQPGASMSGQSPPAVPAVMVAPPPMSDAEQANFVQKEIMRLQIPVDIVITSDGKFLYNNIPFTRIPAQKQPLFADMLESMIHLHPRLRREHYCPGSRAFPVLLSGHPVSDVSTLPEPLAEKPGLRVAVLCCSTIVTQNGLPEPVKIAAVDVETCRPLLNYLICPPTETKIRDWNTSITGLTGLHDIEAARQAGFKVIKSWKAARTALGKFLDRKTILLGYRLRDDLDSLRLMHGTAVDIVKCVEKAADGPLSKQQLHLDSLCRDFLQIKPSGQSPFGRDCLQDAYAVRELTLWMLKNADEFTRKSKSKSFEYQKLVN